MKLIKNLFHAFLAAALVFSFTGCSVSTSIDTLLRAPKLTEEQENIYNALIGAVGKNVTLEYPKTGSNLSAFIVSDFDNDSREEALVFYKKNSGSGESNGLVRINVLDQKDGRWYSVHDMAAEGMEIEKVEVSPMGPDHVINIIVGYSITEDAGKILDIYQYANGQLNISDSSVYSYFHTGNFDGDGQNELFILQNPSNGEEILKAQLAWSDAAGLVHTNQIYLNEQATGFQNVCFGKSYNEIYIDENLGTANMQTEVLKVKDKTLSLCLPDAVKTKRPSGIAAGDYDADGEIEIPVQEGNFPVESEKYSQVPVTVWYGLSGSALVEKEKGIYNIKNGIAFFFPSKWKRGVTAYIDAARGEYVICQYSDITKKQGDELLRIAPQKTESTARELESEGYKTAETKMGIYCMYFIPKNSSSLQLDENVIKKSFCSMN